MSTEAEIEAKTKELAELIIDHLNATAQDVEGPVMLTSYILVVEGNGVDPHGERVTRDWHDFHGSLSQIKGMLVDTLDGVRDQTLDL